MPAQLSELSAVRRFVDAAAREFGFDGGGSYALQLAATEAVTNAIQHGSPSPGDRVEVRVLGEGDALAVHVTDPGTFIPRVQVPDDLPEQGRGLVFMEQLMDEVEVRALRHGTEVRFAKRLAGG